MKNALATQHFAELLLTLLKGKTSLLDAIGILSREGIEKPVRESASLLMAIMKKGKGFSECLRILNGGKVFFEPLYLSLIAAAELTGSIEAVLERVVADLQRKRRARENAVNILIYPAMIVLLAVAGTVAIIAKGMPLFISAGLLSPAALSDAKQGIAAAGAVLLAGGSVLFTVYFKIFNNDSPETKIFYLLALLLENNVALVDALSQCIINVGQNKYGSVLVAVKKDITSGKSFSGSFAKTKLFSAYILGWLSIADKRGDLNEICGKITEHYVHKDEKKRETAAKLIEPAVILLVGIYVLIIMVTVVLPILSYTGGIL